MTEHATHDRPRTLLETRRLVLRELSFEDLDFVAAMLADPAVMRFYPKCHTRAEAREWIARQRDRYARDGHGLWLVHDRTGDQPVGQVGLSLQPIDGVQLPEIGWLLHRPFWGRGLATEAAAAVRDYAFGARGYPRVVSLIQPDNAPSQAVAYRLGMTVAGRTRWAGIVHDVFGLARAAP
ncbi:MAG: GNAT family N-acetyltransferase [Candidatus Krumholzibacteria bacterium]|nr:GNAT family N-acetyltransferase [Candidatus Krumholzibacteria bacterium]